jgi:transcriptional regulator NrdR family protein
VFSTHEQAVYEGAWRIKEAAGSLSPFLREKLLLSLYKSCEHRPTALTDASALTDTVIARVRSHARDGVILSSDITKEVFHTLQRFDKAAAVHYRAFHPA